MHVRMLLEVNEVMHMIGPSETRYGILFVFPNTLNQVRGYADIKRTVPLARENVYSGLLCHGAKALDSRFRGNDEEWKQPSL